MPPLLPIGTRLGFYEILAPIGAGGMGQVYKALDTRLGRTIAIKILPPNVAGHDDRQRRFLREARAASQLNHPHIVTIHDVGSTEDCQYIVMEFVDGQSLRDRLKGRKLTWKQVLDYSIQIASALGAAHAAGIIHRDLKPANVMISAEGVIKVLDFGLAKQISREGAETSADHITLKGEVLGTPAYMSPEQVLGDETDARSDVFSFGIVLYEMIAGLRPFAADTRLDTVRKIVHEGYPPLVAIAPGTPFALQDLVIRCLEKDPAQRFRDGSELCKALEDVAAELAAPGETLVMSKGGKPARSKPGNIHLWLPAIAVLAMLMVVAYRYWWIGTQPKGPRGVAVLPFTAINADDRTRAFSLGLAVVVSANLSGLDGFRSAFWVVPVADVIQNKAQSARDAREMFGVDRVITGSVETANDRVRVTANVSDAVTQRQIRSQQITRPAGDALVLEDELVRVVGELLGIELSPEARAQNRPSGIREPAAEDFYLQGRGYLEGKSGNEDFAIQEFQSAIAHDPRFAQAHAGLGDAFLQKYFSSKDIRWLEKARSSSSEAIRVGGQTPEALLTAGAIEDTGGHYAEAAAHFRQVLALNARNREAWLRLAEVLERENLPRDAEDALQKATDLEPGYPGGHIGLALFYYRAGRYPEAEASFQRAKELAPSNPLIHHYLAALYIQTGRYKEAEAAAKRSLELKPSALAYNDLTSCYFYQERYKDAIPPLENALKLGTPRVGVLGNLARLYRLTPGLEAKARPILDQAFALAGTELKVNPRDALVRADLAWLRAESGEKQAAVREIELAQEYSPDDGAVLFRAVLVYEIIGDRNRALVAYRSLQQRGSYLEEVRRRPELKSLRADPRF